MQLEESFGVIPLSKKKGHWEVFLIQHQRGRYWGFPKGHAEEGESPEETATRELKEETNLEITRYLSNDPLSEEYQFLKAGVKTRKRVVYFVAEVTGTVALQEAEIQAGLWIPLPEALKKATHREGKEILSRVAKILETL